MAFHPQQNDFAKRLVKAFVLEGRKVARLVLDVRMDDVVRVYVEEIVTVDRADGVASLIDEYAKEIVIETEGQAPPFWPS